MDLAELLAASMQEQSKIPSRPHHLGHIARLKESLAHYLTPNPYKVGDLVTPRKDSVISNSGEPHIVMESRQRPSDPTFCEQEHVYSSGYGPFLDIRVGVVSVSRDGSQEAVALFWGESHNYEPYRADAIITRGKA